MINMWGDYRDFLMINDFDEDQAIKDLDDSYKEYEEFCIRNNNEIIEKIKPLVSENYLKAIIEFLNDEELGIYGELELVSEVEGEWQEENEAEYWNELKGMYITESGGYFGDDYYGTLELNISNGLFLRCYFSG